MAHYLLYVPGAKGANNKHLVDRGLSQLLADGGPDWVEFNAGPDGGRGMLCTWRRGHPELDAALEVDMERQSWQPGPGNKELGIARGSYWIGHEKARPPKPMDLARTIQHPGRQVELRDGWDWLIPEAMQLPHLVGLDPETGETAVRICPEFAAFAEDSERYALILFEQIHLNERVRRANPKLQLEEVKRDFALPEAFEYATMALSLNYRVCQPIVDYLGLVTKSEIVRILTATVCFDDILEVIDDQKKTEEVVSVPVG